MRTAAAAAAIVVSIVRPFTPFIPSRRSSNTGALRSWADWANNWLLCAQIYTHIIMYTNKRIAIHSYRCVHIYVCQPYCDRALLQCTHNSTTQSDEAECICCYYGCFIIVTKPKHTIEVKRIQRRYIIFWCVACYTVFTIIIRCLFIHFLLFSCALNFINDI